MDLQLASCVLYEEFLLLKALPSQEACPMHLPYSPAPAAHHSCFQSILSKHSRILFLYLLQLRIAFCRYAAHRAFCLDGKGFGSDCQFSSRFSGTHHISSQPFFGIHHSSQLQSLLWHAGFSHRCAPGMQQVIPVHE